MSGIPEITAYPLPTAQQLPANLARWSLEPRRAVLLVHDMQRYFLRPLPESLRAGLVANAARLRRWCVEQGVQIAYTAQPGSMTEEQRGLLKDFWGPGMRASPADREVVEELAPERNLPPGDRGMSGIPEITAYPLPTAQQLPANLARWSLEPRRAVLLVHDMQRYFLRPLPESLRAGLVANAARLRRWCLEQGVQIAYTAQPGSMTEEQRGLL
ncbi:isochorismatase family protein, partial [Pseudomonas aeruginosa]